MGNSYSLLETPVEEAKTDDFINEISDKVGK
jgi:hypothetical protein